MATTNDEILISVRISEEDVEKKLLADREALARLNKEIAVTNKEYKEGVITAKEYALSQQAIKTQISKTSAEIKTGEKTLVDYRKSQDAAEGSLEMMRAQLALVVPQIAKLSKAERESTEAGQNLVALAGELTDKLKEQEKAYGSNQRNVGNYGEALAGTEDKLTTLIAAEQKNTAELGKGSKSVGDFVKQVKVGGVSVGEFSEKLKGGAGSTASFVKSIFSVKGALTALTAVPILLVLSAIVGFLTKSKDGMELFGRKTAAVKAVLDLFVGKIIDFGRGIVEAFTDPVQAVKDLGTAIQENLSNRFAAFGLILQAVRKGSVSDFFNALLQLGTGVKDVVGKVGNLTEEMRKAAANGEAVAREFQLIADAERELGKIRSASRAEFEKQKFIAEDVSKSLAEREKAARSAFAIENSLLQRQLKLQERRIANTIKEQGLSENVGKDYDKLAEEEAKLSDLKAESVAKQTEINNKINDLRKQAQQDQIRGQLAVLNEGLRITKERGFQTLEIEKQIIAKQLEFDLVGVIKGSETEKALRLKAKADLATAILNDVIAQNERQNRLENEYIQARIEQEQEGSVARLKIQDEAIKQRAFQEEATARILIKNEEELAAALKVIEANKVRDRKAILQQIKDIEIKALDDLLAARLARTRAGSKEEYRVQMEQIRKRIADALKDERVGAEEFQKIQEEGFRALSDLSKNHVQEVANKAIGAAQDLTGALTSLVDASVARQTAALDAQQESILSSAALTADQRAKIEADFAKKREKIEKEAAEKRRKIASLENIINTAASVTKAFATAGPILGAILAALAVAKGIASQVVIDNQKFASGGYVSDKKGAYVQGPGTGKSDSINARISNGESIINAESTRRYYATLSAINVAGGGRAFPGVGRNLAVSEAVPRFQQGGTALMGIDTLAIAQAIRDGMFGVNIRVGVDEVTKAQNSVKRAVVGGDI
ncbi:hypothetical protein [Spirosoma luteum]|uniref:hypothetical protein n=1 Tax=Spirosoma luteum TaxID=431553 RepID=UPI000374D289|nr:hypothetical protein [Spirosoma luteum]